MKPILVLAALAALLPSCDSSSTDDGFFEPFSPGAVAGARANGRPVLLEAYAKW